ncbi:MAG: Propionyl-CoA carboxylase [candidate division TM6 bacterium GW2011_GWF2_28_16]|nr:MAG: Propionyl-CoA carboxylase [candidate division TM6 bacterium GW2011_GWF2_28_16]
MSQKQLFLDKKILALTGGGQEKIAKQKELGKLTARERINLLLDNNSFHETDMLVSSQFSIQKNYTDGVITGFGTINNQKVAIYSQDFTLNGGSLGKSHGKKICKIMDLAAKIGCPIIGIIDSGGARIQEGIHGLSGFGDIFFKNVRYSGVIPQISIILGPCAGGAVYSPALTDFIFTVENISQLFITGPNVIKESLGQEISKEELGGAKTHNSKSGVSHFMCQTEQECFDKVKVLLEYIPANYLDPKQENINFIEPEKINLENIVPENTNKSYDIKLLINYIFDKNSFFEIQELFAQNIITGFATLSGNIVAIVANQPLIKAGVIDIDASEKAARFIRFCDSFSIPIISLVDVPGFLPGIDQEHNGIIRRGAKLLYAYAESTVPKITLILRKAFGGAYIVMGSKQLGADFNFSWPNAQIAVLGAQAAVSILYQNKIKQEQDINTKKILTEELIKNYEQEFLNPFMAAEHGYIDAIIEPNNTREQLINALEIIKTKVEKLPAKKHGNIPL